MKIRPIILTIIFSGGLHAQSYEAPDVKYESKDSAPVHVQKPNPESWKSNYKVEQELPAQRELASEQDVWVDYKDRETSRDPSSTSQDAPREIAPGVKSWPWPQK